ncbi:cystathionine gamma-synthase [Umbelopsis sp. PMI_123]|nr:cystathionine gamma-synthase [Umbelopsis sp. PMI_123]
MVHLDEDPSQLGFASLAIHADDHLSTTTDVAPAIHVSTTYLQSGSLSDTKGNIYSRASTDTRDRVEQVLGKLNKGHAITYSSGLSSGFAVLLHIRPERIAIRGGYHGTHGFIEVYKRHRDIPVIDIDDELKKGDLLWLESPLNPTGEVYDVVAYSERAHKVGAILLVDSTFAPPPLSWPIELGADIVMHSTTKYFAGHSDALGGLLVVKSEKEAESLLRDRNVIGSVLGSLEAWLILRSLRTLKVRVLHQSQTTNSLVAWLNLASGGKAHDGIPANAVHSVKHASIQDVKWDIQRQFPGGYGATFSILLTSKTNAQQLPFRLKLFHAATSLGGVESLAEWRYQWDLEIDDRLVRISVGLEELEDLKQDFRQALSQQ